jgi:uncharacterized protein (DUF885 family)
MMKNLFRCTLILAVFFLGIGSAGCSAAKPTDETTSQIQHTTPAVEAESEPGSDEAPSSQPAEAQAVEPETSSSGKTGIEASSIDNIIASLEDLPLGMFFEESFKQLVLRYPETITEEGLDQVFGTGNDQLNNLSDSYIRETQTLEKAILEILRTHDRESLPAEMQVSYDVYEWYLEDLVRGHEYMYNDYPVTHFITGVQNQTINFFTDIHPVTNLEDAEDYIKRLSQVDTKFEQLIEGLKLRQEAGVVLPKFVIQWTVGDIRSIANAAPSATPFYSSFAEKVRQIEGLSDEEQQALLDAAEQEIEASVIPAFKALADTLDRQASIATSDHGVWKFPNGEAYYQYTLSHHTSTDMTPDEIHELGLQEVERLRGEMRSIFIELGYPENESLNSLFGRVVSDSGELYGQEIVAGYEAIITEAEQKVSAAFDLRPSANVVVLGVPHGGYYIGPARDGSRPGAFYATQNGSETKFSMPSLAYHEAVPGHHFQIAIAQELDLPGFRTAVGSTAYTEGWALYAELLAHELGFYEDDPYGNLGRLQMEIFRAARLVVDTGIHAMGWTFDQGVKYMQENTGMPPGQIEFEVSRYISWPGQATAYKIGMLKILELRQRAMEQLGDQFDLKEFHNVVIGNGSMPLDVLDRVVQDYIDTKLAGSAETTFSEQTFPNNLMLVMIWR